MTYGQRYLIFAAAALVYLASLHIVPYGGQFAAKALPILMLAALFIDWSQATAARWVGAGLVLSAIADMLLTGSGDSWFLSGVAVFALAHICYGCAFWKLRRPTLWSVLRALPVLMAAAGLTYALYPHLGPIRPAVMGYISIITLAGLSAAMLPSRRWFAYAGMLIFMASDATIAINRFVTPVPAADYVIMTTYYVAQLLIAVGITRTTSKRQISGPDPAA